MKYRGLFFLSAALMFMFFITPVLSGAAVRIELKNGRSITADYCRESGNVFACSKMGGIFEIEKSEVGRIRKISDDAVSDPEEPGPSEPEPGGADVKTAAAADLEKPGEKPEDRRKEAEKKMEELQQRKLELSKERENLVKEREALQEDMKKAPDWMPDKQYDELKKRNADFDAKLKKFNDEVNDIRDKEKKISEETGTKPAEAPPQEP